MDSKSLEHLKARRSHLDRCFMRHRVPEDGETHAQILDDYFRERFSVSLAGFKMDLISNPYAIIAVGSYGRKEVFPKAEARILFIFNDRIPDGAVELIRDIVYPLWDLGYTVNHSTKTLKDAVAGATADYGALCSLLCSRFICGISPLYSRLMTQIREKIVYRKKREILSFLYDRDEARNKKFGGTEYLLEPDLFFSPSGLSDVNSLFSAAQVAWDAGETADLKTTGILSSSELNDLLESRDFIRNLIVFLQLSAEGNRGRLTVDLQKDAARFFNYKNRGADKAVDLFLSDVEKRKDMIRIIRKRIYSSLVPEKTAVVCFTENEVKTAIKWVVISKGLVKVTSLSKLRKHPELLFSILEESEAGGTPISPETIQMMTDSNTFVPKGFFDDHAVLQRFESHFLDSSVSGQTTDVMIETGLFFAFIPEFKELAHKRIFSYQPCYPVLKHALLTLTRLKELIGENGEQNKETLSGENRYVVMWAALLHVVFEDSSTSGKTRDAIRIILARFRKTPVFIKKVLGLLELNQTMLRLLHGEDPWNDLAFKPLLVELNSPVDLGLLHLLSLADLRARASRCFSDFKEADLRHGILACFNLKGWTIPSGLDKNDPVFALKQTSASSRPENSPSVHLHKTDNMRVLRLGFPASAEPILPALHALGLSGIDLYDLRLFPPDNGWADLLIRVKAPKDSMFEMKKWAGFEAHLKDILNRRIVTAGDGPNDMKSSMNNRRNSRDSSEKKADPDTDVVVFRRTDMGETVIIIHNARSGESLCHIVKNLQGQGLSVFYIKKTCCERDFCLVVHASAEGDPDENTVKEVVYDACET